MSRDDVRPLIVREAKRRLAHLRKTAVPYPLHTIRPFSMADFIAGGVFALELLAKLEEPDEEEE